jgi:hypothetical protein
MSDFEFDADRLEVAVVLSELGNTASESTNDNRAESRGRKRQIASVLDSSTYIPPTKKGQSTTSADAQLAEANAAVATLRFEKEHLQGCVAALLERLQFLVRERERASLEQQRTTGGDISEQLLMVQFAASEQRRMERLAASNHLGMLQQTLLNLNARANSYKHQNDELQKKVVALNSSEQAKEIHRLNTELDKLKSNYDTTSSSATSKRKDGNARTQTSTQNPGSASKKSMNASETKGAAGKKKTPTQKESKIASTKISTKKRISPRVTAKKTRALK